MLKTVKGLRFYPTCKLVSWPVSFMGAGRKYETSGSETRDRILLIAINIYIESSMPTVYGSTPQKWTLSLGNANLL